MLINTSASVLFFRNSLGVNLCRHIYISAGPCEDLTFEFESPVSIQLENPIRIYFQSATPCPVWHLKTDSHAIEDTLTHYLICWRMSLSHNVVEHGVWLPYTNWTDWIEVVTITEL